MNLFGNRSEKQKYNIVIILYSSCVVILVLGALLKSGIIMILGFVLAFIMTPVLIIAKTRYYTFLYSKLHQKEKERTFLQKKDIIIPVFLGLFMILVGIGFIIFYAGGDIIVIYFQTVAIIGLLIVVYHVYKWLRYRS